MLTKLILTDFDTIPYDDIIPNDIGFVIVWIENIPNDIGFAIVWIEKQRIEPFPRHRLPREYNIIECKLLNTSYIYIYI